MYYTNHFSALLSPVNSTAPIQSKVQQLLCQTPRNTSWASQKLREAVFNGNCFQATFLSPEITRRFLNHMFVIIFPHKCLKIFHVMPSQKIHHQLKNPTNNYSNSLQHYEWPKSPCWHDTSISGDIHQDTTTKRFVKAGLKGSPVQFPHRGATNRQLHGTKPPPVTWPQEAGSKHWPWHPAKTSHLNNFQAIFLSQKTSVEKTLSLSVVLKEGLF